jgi:hypothetical protein
MVMSISIIIVLWFEMNVADFSILGIEPGTKLDESTFAVLVFLSVSHIVNWTGDAISNGRFSLLSKKQPLEGMDDIAKERSYICSIKQKLEGIENHLEKLRGDDQNAGLSTNLEKANNNMKSILEKMDIIEKSSWWFSVYARFYVVGWNLVVPLALAALAANLLRHA